MKLSTEKLQNGLLTLLRIAIGWHFLYEGISKLMTAGWSSAAYLQMSQGILSPIFKTLSAQPPLIMAVDILNIALLIFIGLFLILGIWTRIVCFMGAALLFFIIWHFLH